MTKAQCVMIINIFKSNHVCFRMEMGQGVENPGLNPGITNKALCINPWLYCLCRNVEKDRNTQNTSHQYYLCIIYSQWNNWICVLSFPLQLGQTKENGVVGRWTGPLKRRCINWFIFIISSCASFMFSLILITYLDLESVHGIKDAY